MELTLSPPTPLALALTGWAAMAIVMAALWLLQRRTQDAGVVDVAWAAGLGFLACLFAGFGDAPPLRRILLAALAGVWSGRLATHLLLDRVIGKEEDGRYADLRSSWGDGFQAKIFWFFQAQGLLDVLLALPFLVVAFHGDEPGWTDWLAVAVWAVAVGGETIADRQLAAFRREPSHRGRTCRVGLWRYSRHPNYFFEWVHWLAYPLLAWGASLWWLTWVSPAVMLYLVLKVTGIPPTERQALRSRGEDYRRYQRTTSAFFPWFPREDKS